MTSSRIHGTIHMADVALFVLIAVCVGTCCVRDIIETTAQKEAYRQCVSIHEARDCKDVRP